MFSVFPGVFFGLVPDFLDWFLFYFFVFCQCEWFSRLFMSSVVAVLSNKVYGCFQIYGFFTDYFLSKLFVSNACDEFRYQEISFICLKSQLFLRLLFFSMLFWCLVVFLFCSNTAVVVSSFGQVA